MPGDLSMLGSQQWVDNSLAAAAQWALQYGAELVQQNVGNNDNANAANVNTNNNLGQDQNGASDPLPEQKWYQLKWVQWTGAGLGVVGLAAIVVAVSKKSNSKKVRR